MNIVSLEGSYSVGKSTVFDKIEKQKDTIYTPDLARHYLAKNRWNSNTLTDEQKRELQLMVSASYIGGMRQATHAKMNVVQDSSLITAFAYSEDILPVSTLAHLALEIEKYADRMYAIVFPPTIHIDNDGLRHIDPEFRIEIHKRIMNIITAFGIKYHMVLSHSVDDRVAEVEEVINSCTS